MAEAMMTFYNGATNALTDIFTGAKSASEAFTDLGKSILKMLAHMGSPTDRRAACYGDIREIHADGPDCRIYGGAAKVAARGRALRPLYPWRRSAQTLFRRWRDDGCLWVVYVTSHSRTRLRRHHHRADYRRDRRTRQGGCPAAKPSGVEKAGLVGQKPPITQQNYFYGDINTEADLDEINRRQ
jgi:hypothetical protein